MKLKILFLLTSIIGFSFAADIDIEERKEAVAIDMPTEQIIIPTKFKDLSQSKNCSGCLKRLAKKIEHLKLYKLLDKYVIKKGNKLIVKNAKGVMVIGLLGMQMIASKIDVGGPVVVMSQIETGKGITQYGIHKKLMHKKLDPKILIFILLGMSFLVKWLCTFDTFGQEVPAPTFEPYDVADSSSISANNTVADDYNIILNNCLIDLNDVLSLGYPTQPYNYSIPNVNSAVNACLQNLNALINISDVVPVDPWQFLTDYKSTFLISVFGCGLYILQQLAKTQNSVTSQSDVKCMEIQTDDTLSDEELDDINFDNNTSGKLLYIPSNEIKTADVGCMTNQEDVNASVITTQTDAGSSFVTPHVTPEKLRVSSPKNTPSSPSNTFRIINLRRNNSTQVKNNDGISLSDCANMQTTEGGKELFSRVKGLDDQFLNLALD
ncbi:MAG: hypothetical protein P4L22_05495 [Candidatus Babeliales bacterium]|nr:hypothetical protein [Candidatus Babeliales bacterium]